MNTYRQLRLMPDGGGGSGNNAPQLNDFVRSLPADLHGEKSLHTMTDVGTLAKSYVHSQRLIGAKRLEAPQPTWGEGDWNTFYEAAGRPKTPDDYLIPEYKFESDPKLKPDANRIKSILPELHKAGLSARQAEQVLGVYFKTVDGDLKTVKASRDQAKSAAEADLRAAWGDKYDANVDLARSVVKKFGDEDFLKYVAEQGGNDPRLIRALAKIGSAMMEDSSRGGNSGNELQLTDATRATTEIERLKLDKDFMKAFRDKSDPAHRETVQRWMNLHKAALGPNNKTIEPS